MRGGAGLAARAVVQAGLAERTEDVRVHSHASGLFTIVRADAPLGRAAVKLEPASVCRAEVEGLEALRATGAPVPRVLSVLEEEGNAALVMEFLEAAKASRSEDSLASALAGLYRMQQVSWGWPGSNFIGSLPQPNQVRSAFEVHWWHDRIQPQLDRAVLHGLLPSSLSARLEKMIHARSSQWQLGAARPRLVHGDLWSGNVFFSTQGPMLIDPAVAWGHPEQDLAMLELFGSPLSARMLDQVALDIGLSPGRAERRSFFQLYPLLVHVNIFGSGYKAQFEEALAGCE